MTTPRSIAGPITYSYWDRDTNNGRQSVVKKQGNWFEGSDALKSDLFNQNVDLTNVNNNDYSKYNGADGYLRSYRNNSPRLQIPARSARSRMVSRAMATTTSSTSTITKEQAIHSLSMVVRSLFRCA